jgi:hypothetical protein
MKSVAIIIVLLLSRQVASPVWAQGRKPEKMSSKSDKPAHPIKDLKEGANQALNGVDSGIHQALPVAKDAANKALNAVDQGVHKVVGSDTK